ncbi:MBL fold metallo-hydrolase [Chloroflexota bacterium]
MADVSEVADGIYQIEIDEVKTSGSLELFRCSLVYFIIANGQTALIETGPAVVAPVVLSTIRRLGHDPFQISYILLTHIHLDHAGGAGTLAHQFPQLQVLVHQRGVAHLIDPSKLIEGTRQAYGKRFEDEYGPILPIPEWQVRAVDDGEVIQLGERELRIIYAPGHAPHQMCIYETKSQGIFTGDALGSPPIENSIVLPVAGFNLDSALESIDKLSKLNPKVVFFSHGGVSREAARLMQSVRANTKAYGDIILEAMKAGEGKEQMIRRLEAYHIERVPGEYQLEEQRFDHIIPWYVAHFKRKGVA